MAWSIVLASASVLVSETMASLVSTVSASTTGVCLSCSCIPTPKFLMAYLETLSAPQSNKACATNRRRYLAAR